MSIIRLIVITQLVTPYNRYIINGITGSLEGASRRIEECGHIWTNAPAPISAIYPRN